LLEGHLACLICQVEVKLPPWEYPCWISPDALLELYLFVL
jgi:hypothetical protein